MDVALTAISATLSTVEDPWKRPARRSSRLPIGSDAALRRTGGRAVRVTIVDLSIHGFRVETHLDLAAGDSIWVRLPSLSSRHALVIWRRQNEYGCTFEEPLHPAVLTMIAERA